MAGCCDPGGCRRVFNTEEAQRAAKRFRRKGLDTTARAMVDALDGALLEASVLEAGAGTGGAHVEMLRRGAARATAVEISDAYDDVATAIATDMGVADRVERRIGDFVDVAHDVGPHDIVYLNRVVCCYPDMPAMIGAAVGGSAEHVAVSYPRDRWFVRLGFRVLNGSLRLRKVPFRVFVHDPDDLARRMEAAGFEPTTTGRSFVWHWGVWARVAVG
jgi:magnesium-protoporphyrin O-methyltransferase